MNRFVHLCALLFLLLSSHAAQAAVPTPPPSQPPVILSSTSAPGAVGIRFSYQIIATNSPTRYTALFLPAGLSIDEGTGLITGVTETAGTYQCYLDASNASGTATLALTITVRNLPPAILSDGTGTAFLYQEYNYQIAASNHPLSFSAENLPPGLRVDADTGLISGTPIETGSFTVTLGATNVIGTGTSTLLLTVSSTLPTVTVQATVPRVAVDSDGSGEIVVTRAGGDLTQKLVVTYVVQGSARSGLDYVTLTGQKKIKPGHPTATIRIVPKGFLSGGEARAVKVKLLPEPTYQLGDTIKAKVKIVPAS